MDKLTLAAMLLVIAEKGGVEHALKLFGNDVKVKFFFPSELLSHDVDELALSVRSYNCMKRSNLNTIDKVLAQCGEDGNLKAIKNLGKKSISEIKTNLIRLAYDKMTDEQREAFWLYVIEHNAPEGLVTD